MGEVEREHNRFDLRQWAAYLGLRARQGARRVRGAWWPVLQASIAAFIAYSISHFLLGRQMPFFAPIAAWICLGFTLNRVPRKVAEMGIGATLGVLIGEVLYLWFGEGAWQITLALVVGALVGRFMDRGDLFTMQTGVNAVVVVGLGSYASASGGVMGRSLDALVGAAVAFVFSVFLPRDLGRRPRRNVRSIQNELASLMSVLAEGLKRGSIDHVRDADARLRGVEQIMTDAQTAVNSASEISRLNPAMRTERAQLTELARQCEILNRTLHSVEVLLRQARGLVLEAGTSIPVAILLDEGAAVLRSLSADLAEWIEPTDARAEAKALAVACLPDEHRYPGWRAGAMVSVMRSVAVDLLQMTGLSLRQAREVLPETEPREDVSLGVDASDGPSGIWGVSSA